MKVQKMKVLLTNLLVCMVFCIFVYGCANKRPVVVASYEGLGTTTTSVVKAAKILCEEGKIKQEDCNQIKKIYNDIRRSYIDAGDLYIKVIETGSDEAITNYKAHIQVIFEGLKKIEKYLE